MNYTYLLGKANRPKGQKTADIVREQLDALGIGQDLTEFLWGVTHPPLPLPPSKWGQNKA